MGRGERVLPGVWRLKLPLPWEGIPHCNAWALAAGDGIVLVDCGMDLDGSWRQLELTLGQCGLHVDDVRLVVGTHAHADHIGQAATLRERTGAPVWMHRDRRHLEVQLTDPDALVARRMEIGRASGVPEAPLRAWAAQRAAQGSGVAEPLVVDRELAEGDTVETDVGTWRVLETPGHAPSHVVLHQPERRLLISGDLVLGRVALYFDYGYTPDPVGEFLASLDRVDALDVRLTLAGHAKPFTDLRGHVEGNRRLVNERLDGVRAALAGGEDTAYDIARRLYGEAWSPENASWLLTKTLCYLAFLERRGVVTRQSGQDAAERWSVAA